MPLLLWWFLFFLFYFLFLFPALLSILEHLLEMHFYFSIVFMSLYLCIAFSVVDKVNTYHVKFPGVIILPLQVKLINLTSV